MPDVQDSIVEVPRGRLEEAVEVLSAAFRPDPAIRWLLNEASPGYETRLRELMRFSCEVRLHLDWPLLGIEEEGQLLAVMGVTMPDEKEWPDSLQVVYGNLGKVIGSDAVQRLEDYSQLADAGRPNERHFHVGIIGVAPNAQGRGVGKRLLNAIHDMSSADEASVGVALDTENPNSRRFYEANGYQCTSEESIGGVPIWSMFRPNS